MDSSFTELEKLNDTMRDVLKKLEDLEDQLKKAVRHLDRIEGNTEP